jgi:hypothetical protein
VAVRPRWYYFERAWMKYKSWFPERQEPHSSAV